MMLSCIAEQKRRLRKYGQPIALRMQVCGLAAFHPEKTKIVYCKDDD